MSVSKFDKKELHVWSTFNAAWFPLEHALSSLKKKGFRPKRKTMISKKFGGLDPLEILMYEAVERSSIELFELSLPHELLMVILVYSQGYKFEKGDQCIFFPSGIFADSVGGEIKEVVDQNAPNDSYQYLARYDNGGGHGPSFRVPPNHVFATNIVIINEPKFKELYPSHKDKKFGDVLPVVGVRVQEEAVYSKRKKRKVRKQKLVVDCLNPGNVIQHGVRYSMHRVPDLSVKWDHDLFVQAKMKKVSD